MCVPAQRVRQLHDWWPHPPRRWIHALVSTTHRKASLRAQHMSFFCRWFLYDACFVDSGALPNDLDAKTSCAASHHLAHLVRQYVSTYLFFGNIDILHFDLGNFVYMLDAHSPSDLGTRLSRTCRNISRAL